MQYNSSGDGSVGPIKPGSQGGEGSGDGSSLNGSSNQNEIVDVAEINPEFPGGLEKMYRYLGNNLRYPRYLMERRISGTVFVSFVVSKSGEINQVEILKSPNDGFNDEVIRVINKMPKWRPGIQAGKPVSVRYKMPIKFTLRD
jgi:periplasmic protein TonB